MTKCISCGRDGEIDTGAEEGVFLSDERSRLVTDGVGYRVVIEGVEYLYCYECMKKDGTEFVDVRIATKIAQEGTEEALIFAIMFAARKRSGERMGGFEKRELDGERIIDEAFGRLLGDSAVYELAEAVAEVVGVLQALQGKVIELCG